MICQKLTIDLAMIVWYILNQRGANHEHNVFLSFAKGVCFSEVF